MGAVTRTRDITEAAVMAIEAGADIVLICGSLEAATRAWEAMVRAAQDESITRQRISRSFDNIARVKSTLSPPLPYSEMAVSRLRERIGELNLQLQHGR
jgi:beta-N-acetylhexosaminidase